jgi:tetratricopeptide (TPR) repeat protein
VTCGRGRIEKGFLAQIQVECYGFGVSARPTVATPEDYLRRAMAARTAGMRARWAQRGLASRTPLDKTTQAMLLRQLYLSRFEARRFHEAHHLALQAATLDVMTDVMFQDAARAALAEGDVDAAVAHLRAAARRSPASRRPFHLWTLGSTLFLTHKYAEAIAALTRAARWGTRDKPLYRAHLALARIAGGEPVEELQETIEALAQAPCGQGYGRFVLGHLAYAAGEWGAAKRYLDAFVKRTGASRPAMSVALELEMRMAKATLAKMAAN